MTARFAERSPSARSPHLPLPQGHPEGTVENAPAWTWLCCSEHAEKHCIIEDSSGRTPVSEEKGEKMDREGFSAGSQGGNEATV